MSKFKVGDICRVSEDAPYSPDYRGALIELRHEFSDWKGKPASDLEWSALIIEKDFIIGPFHEKYLTLDEVYQNQQKLKELLKVT